MASVLIISPSRILTAHGNGKICVFDIRNQPEPIRSNVPNLRTPTCTVQAHEGRVSHMLVIPESSSGGATTGSSLPKTVDMMSAGTDGHVKLWRFFPDSSSIEESEDTLELLSDLVLFSGPVTASAVSSDGKWLFVAGECDDAGIDETEASSQIKAVNRTTGLVKDVGERCRTVSHLHCTPENKLLVALMKEDNKAYGEAWDVSDAD